MNNRNVDRLTGTTWGARQRKKRKGTCRVSRSILPLAAVVAVCSAVPLSGANVSIPSLEIYTWGRMVGSTFQLDSYGDMELQLDGGYKFGCKVVFNFLSSTLETATFNDTLAFQSASVTLRELFNIPLDFTYFIGEGDTFATGDLFVEYFDTPVIGSRYTRYVHFADAAVLYEGIYTVNGTGAELSFAPIEKNWLAALYLYQDSSFTSGVVPPVDLEGGHGSMDLRSAFNFENIKLEAFLGLTYPTPGSTVGWYRGGFLFYAGGRGVEFLAGFGLPRWAPLDDSFGFDLFYMLLEQRVRLGLVSVIQTVFWRPSYYQQEETGEEAIDINLNVQLSNPEKSLLVGGVEGNFVYQIEESAAPVHELRVKVVPYVQFFTSGVVYEIRSSARVWPLDFSDMFEVFLSVDASF
jgi:hypothetical protein